MLPATSPPDYQGRAILLWSTPFLCLPCCRLPPLGGSAARRACAAVLPCASDTPPSLAGAFAFRAPALLVGHAEAGPGCVLAAADYGRYPTPMRSFPGRASHVLTGCHPTKARASSKALSTQPLRRGFLRSSFPGSCVGSPPRPARMACMTPKHREGGCSSDGA